MSSITERQKAIYNLYLKAFRVNNGGGWRAKKNFADVEKDPAKMISLQKLEQVFEKYPAFFSDTYFNAPYKIYSDEEKYYSLNFYSSFKGISTCIAYYKTLLQSSPEEQFDFMRDSYAFVGRFCASKGIPLERYTAHCSVAQNDCLIHLKEHKISWYLVFSIPHFYELLHNLPRDEFELYYGSDIDLNALYNRYSLSIKTQQFLAKKKSQITTFVSEKIAEQSVPCDK